MEFKGKAVTFYDGEYKGKKGVFQKSMPEASVFDTPCIITIDEIGDKTVSIKDFKFDIQQVQFRWEME